MTLVNEVIILEMLCQIVEEGMEPADDFLFKRATLNLEHPADSSGEGLVSGIISCTVII